MQKPLVQRLILFFQRGRGFAMGMFCGASLAVAGTALAQDPESKAQFVQALMRAISELAIDTERNAISIAELRQRIDDLELDMAEVAEKED